MISSGERRLTGVISLEGGLSIKNATECKSLSGHYMSKGRKPPPMSEILIAKSFSK